MSYGESPKLGEVLQDLVIVCRHHNPGQDVKISVSLAKEVIEDFSKQFGAKTKLGNDVDITVRKLYLTGGEVELIPQGE